MMTETLKNQKALIDAGFSESDIASWQVQQRQALSDAGYNQAQIDTEFGEPPLDPKPAAKAVRDNIEKAIAPEAVDGEPKPVKDFMEALDAGFQGSITGLLKRGKVPDKTLAEDAPMASRIAGSIGQLAGDVPAMVGGALLGGVNPITGTAGAFALPAGLRKVITDAYEKGEATNWGDFWERASGAIIETAKGYVTGAATGAAGKIIGAAPIASPTAKAAATLSGEVATMVTVGKALEGEVPSANDFIDAAVIVGGAKGAVKTAKKLRDVYSKAGVKPDEFIADTEKDVTIGQDFVAENLPVPRAYGKVTAEFESPERGSLGAAESPATPKAPSKPIWEMTTDELTAAMDAKATADANINKEILGPLAEEFEALELRLERTQNFSDTPGYKKAEQRYNEILDSIPRDQQDRMFGVGEKEPQVTDYRAFQRAIEEVSGETPQELGQSISRAITEVGDGTDPATMTQSEQIAYAQIRFAFQEAQRLGWDTKEVSRAAITASARRFSDPEDAAFMLNRFLKQSAKTPERGLAAVIARSSTRYDMETEDAGTIPVHVYRNADGSVSIIDLGSNGRNTEYPAAFAKGKSDHELLRYTYEPIGFLTATEKGSGSGGKKPLPRVYARFDSPESIAAETMPPVEPGMVRVYRGESTEARNVPDWVREGIEANGSMDAEGRWWTSDPEIADWYVKDAGEHGRMVYQDIPEEVAEAAKVSSLPDAIKKFSLDPGSELFLPKEYKGKGSPVPVTASGSGSGGKKPPRGGSVNDQIKDIADELGQPYPEESPEAARAKMLSKISVRESNDKEPMTFQKLYTDLIDDLNPIREAVKKAAKDGELPTSDDPYQLARLTRGTFGKANQFLEYGTFDFKTYENNGPSLRDILQGKVRDLPEITDAAPVDLDTLRAYIKAKRDLELVSRGVADPDVDVDAATQVVKHWGHYERVAKELTAYQNRLTAYLRDAGIISRDDYDAMLKANKDYVPFFRVMDEDVGGAGLGRGVKTKNPIKSIKGSERNIIDPIESIIKNTYMYLSLAERNAVGTAFVNMANRSGNPGMFMKKLPPEFKATTLKEEEIRALFDEFVTIRKQTSTERATATRSSTESKTETTGGEGAEPQTKQGKMVRDRVLEALSARGFSKGESEQMVARLEGKASGGSTTTDSRTTVETLVKEIEKTEYIPELNIRLPNSVATIFRAVKTPLKDNEIAVFENGKYQKYQVDKEVAEAFNAADSQTAGLLTKILAIPAKMLRAGAVLSPDFMGRNLIRDQTMAFVLSKGGYFPVFDFMRGAFSLAKKDADFQNWLKSGGANAALVSMDREYLQLQLDTLTEVQGVARKAWNVATRPFEMLRITSELIENATRLGEFKRVSGGLTEKAAIQEGGMASREVTVDFARIGAKTRAMSLISAFFNAAVQGEERVIRAFAENPVGVTTKMMAAITLPSILLYLNNREDPRWRQIPRWQKDLFWIVFTDDHTFRIPKPHSAGIIFGSLPERILEAYESDHPGAMRDLEKSILSTFIPNMIPTIAAPIADQFANRSLFTGAPLIPAEQEKMLPEYQYTEYTTELAKAIGQIMGAFPGMRDRSIRDEDTFIGGVARALTTPILVENYVRSWTGGLGMYTLQLADKALREAGVLPDPVKPLDTLADLPFIKAFMVRYPSASAQSIQDFYDDYYAKKRLYDTKMALAKEGDIDAFERVQQIDPMAWDELAGIRDTIADQAKLIRLIYKNPDMTPEDKRQIIDTTYGRMIELAEVGNQAMRDLEKLLGEQ